MTKIDLHEFELQREKLASGLTACAEQLRNTAQVVEDFAKLLGGFDNDTGKGKRKELFAVDDGEGTKKRKRVVKPKDPNAPKRPASSYILFQNEVRTELRKENPNLTNPELLALISERWKNMSEEQKERYNQTQLKLKQEYSEAKSAYDNRSPEEIEAANKAVAEAAASKKANKAPRAKPNHPAVAAVQARPPPEAETEEDDDESDEDEEEEPAVKPHTKLQRDDSSDGESDSSAPESEPAPKRKRGGSAKPQPQKSKKSSKA